MKALPVGAGRKHLYPDRKVWKTFPSCTDHPVHSWYPKDAELPNLGQKDCRRQWDSPATEIQSLSEGKGKIVGTALKSQLYSCWATSWNVKILCSGVFGLLAFHPSEFSLKIWDQKGEHIILSLVITGTLTCAISQEQRIRKILFHLSSGT